jgi:hypothetical protein
MELRSEPLMARTRRESKKHNGNGACIYMHDGNDWLPVSSRAFVSRDCCLVTGSIHARDT